MDTEFHESTFVDSEELMISLVWGVEDIEDSGSKWDSSDIGKLSLDSTFDFFTTANYERLRTICADLEASSLVQNSDVRCFLDDFRLATLAAPATWPITP